MHVCIISSPLIRQIRDYIVEMLQTINPGVSEYTYRYAIDDVMEFERALAGVSLHASIHYISYGRFRG